MLLNTHFRVISMYRKLYLLGINFDREKNMYIYIILYIYIYSRLKVVIYMIGATQQTFQIWHSWHFGFIYIYIYIYLCIYIYYGDVIIQYKVQLGGIYSITTPQNHRIYSISSHRHIYWPQTFYILIVLYDDITIAYIV